MKPLRPLRTGGPARAPKPDHIDALARSFGSAVKFVQRLMPRPRKLSVQAPTAPPPPPLAASAEPKRPAPGALGQIRDRLTREVAELEHEVEHLHGQITSGTAVLTPGGEDRTQALNELIRHSRQVRERLYETRLELARIERHIAREQRLHAGFAAERPASAPRRGAPQRSTRARAPVPARWEGLPFTDRTERLAVARMAENLGSDDPEMRRNAALRLGALDSPAAAQLLLDAVDDASERVQLAALNGLGRLGHPSAPAAFRRFLHHESAALRLAAFRGLVASQAESLTSSDLMAALEDPDAAVRKAAATALGWRRAENTSARVFAALGFALRDPEPEARLAAVEALGNLGDRRGVLTLIRALGDEHPPVREAAVAALRAIVGEDFDDVGRGLEPAARVLAFKQWWRAARVDQAMPNPPGVERPLPEPADLPAAAAAKPESPDRAHAEADEGFVDLFQQDQPTPAASAAAAPSAAPPASPGSSPGAPDVHQDSGESQPEGDEPLAGGGEEYESIFGDGNE